MHLATGMHTMVWQANWLSASFQGACNAESAEDSLAGYHKVSVIGHMC